MAEDRLQSPGVGTVGGRRSSDGKIVYIGENEALEDWDVEGREVEEEQQGGDRGVLRGAHRDRGKDTRGALKEQAAGAVREEGLDPGN